MSRVKGRVLTYLTEATRTDASGHFLFHSRYTVTGGRVRRVRNVEMTAGFVCDGQVFWGTNGAVEEYAFAIARQAAIRLGPESLLAISFQEEADGFFGGKILFLDEWLTTETDAKQFLEVFDAATDELLHGDAFTPDGKAWVCGNIAEMRSLIASRFTA